MTEQKKNAEAALAVHAPPSYITAHGAVGTEKINVATSTPRLVVVQAMSAADIKAEFGEGAMIVRPDNTLAAALGERMTVNPVFRWVSWQKWADVKDSDAVPPIIAETFDAEHVIAKRARSSVFADRREEYGSGQRNLVYRYFESINMIIAVDGGPLDGMVLVTSWRSAGHKHGAKLVRHIDRFGAQGVPIFGHRINLVAQGETNKAGQTYMVIIPRHDTLRPWTGEDRIERLTEMHDRFKSLNAIMTASE